MQCPYCQAQESKVIDKRETENQTVTRRRRECLGCNKRYTTYERVEYANLLIVKKDGTRQPYDRKKLERGILRACEKRPIPTDQITKVIDDVENHLRNKNTIEIQSSLIGRMVMTRLRKIDKVAYIRFASVYKDFEDPEEFHDMLKKLQ